MAAEMSVVKARVDAKLKRSAEGTLEALGLDMTTGVRMFLRQVVLRGKIPFEVSLPRNLNGETLGAIADSYAGRVEKVGSVDALFEDSDA